MEKKEQAPARQCPLCGGRVTPFSPQEIKIPEKNYFSWRGYFDL